MQGYGKASVSHATVVIFLEFFSWGLLTSPTIQVSHTVRLTGMKAPHVEQVIHFLAPTIYSS